MSALLSACCCGPIAGECCSTAWGASQSDDFSFDSDDVEHSVRRRVWNTCTVSGSPDTHLRSFLMTYRTKYSFSNVEMKRRTGQGGQQQKWSLYNGSVTYTETFREFKFGDFDCESDLSCSAGFDLSVTVTATNGTYSNTVTATCIDGASINTAWTNEPSDWTDNWFMLYQSCTNATFTVCQADGNTVEINRPQFYVQPPTGLPLLSGYGPFGPCTSCTSFGLVRYVRPWIANNPDCSENDIPDLEFYSYRDPEGWCDGGGGSNGLVCSEQQRTPGIDVFDTSFPSVTNSAPGTCYEYGFIMPAITIAAI